MGLLPGPIMGGGNNPTKAWFKPWTWNTAPVDFSGKKANYDSKNGALGREIAQDNGVQLSKPPEFDWEALRPLVDAYKAQQEYERVKAAIHAHGEAIRNDLQLTADQKKEQWSALAKQQLLYQRNRDRFLEKATPRATKVEQRLQKHIDTLNQYGFKDEANKIDAHLKQARMNQSYRIAEMGWDQPQAEGKWYDPTSNSGPHFNAAIGKDRLDRLYGEVAHNADMAESEAKSAYVAGVQDKLKKGVYKAQSPADGIAGGAGHVMEMLGWLQENFGNKPYNAAQLSANSGGNWLDAIASAGSATPGLGALSPQDSWGRQMANATDTEEKRDALVKSGQLSSFGENAAKSNFLWDFFGGVSPITKPFSMKAKEQLAANPDKVPELSMPNPLGSLSVDTPLGKVGGDKEWSFKTSTPMDAFFNVASDPLTYTPLALERVARVGELAGKAGITARALSMAEEDGGKAAKLKALLRPADYITSNLKPTPLQLAGTTLEDLGIKELSGARSAARESFLNSGTGRSIMEGGTRALANYDEPGKLAKALQIPDDIAKAALDAKNTKGLAAGRQVLADAFKSGEFNPQVNLRRQLAATLAGRLGVEEPAAVGARGIPFVLGNKTFKTNPRGVYNTLDFLARGDGSRFAMDAGKGRTALDNIIERAPGYVKEGDRRLGGWREAYDKSGQLGKAAERYGERAADGSPIAANLSLPKAGNYSDYWSRYVKPEVGDLSLEERIARLGEDARPSFKAEVDHQLKQLDIATFDPKTLTRDTLSPSSWASPEGRAALEDVVRKLEFTKELLDGKAGKSAKTMVEAELRLNTPNIENFTHLMEQTATAEGMYRRGAYGERMAAQARTRLPQLQDEEQRLATLVNGLKQLDPAEQTLVIRDGRRLTAAELLKEHNTSLLAVRKELRSVRQDVKRYEALKNPFRILDPIEKKELGLAAPRPRAEVVKDLERVKLAIPAEKSALHEELTGVQDAEKARLQSIVDDLSEQRSHMSATDPEFRQLGIQIEQTKLRIKDINKGKYVTPEMSDIFAEVKHLEGGLDKPKPTPLADYELADMKARTGLMDSTIHRAESLNEDQLKAAVFRAEQQLERFKNLPLDEFDVHAGYWLESDPLGGASGAHPKWTERFIQDRAKAAAEYTLYSEMLARVGDRSHPLIAEATDLHHELANYGKQVTAHNQDAITRSIDKRTEEALRRVGIGGQSVMKNTETNRAFLRVRIATIEDENLQKAALEELARLGEKKEGASLRGFAEKVETLIRDEDFRSTAADYLATSKGQVKDLPGRITLRERGVAPILEPILAVLEPVAPTHIRFQSGGMNPLQEMRNRAEDLERVATALHFDQKTVTQFVAAGLRKDSEQGIFELLREMYAEYAVRQGVDPRNLVKAYEKHAGQASDIAFDLGDDLAGKTTRKGQFKLKGAPELKEGVQLQTQLINDIPVLDARDVRRVIRETKAAEGNIGAKARLGLSAVGDASVPFTKGKVNLSDGFKSTHKFWKFAVVTNAPTAGIGAVGGFMTGNDTGDRFRRAALFGSIGLLGSVRYLGRVVGVEERLVRYTAVRGLNPLEWIPVIAKHQRRVGVDLPFRLTEDIASTSHPLAHIEGRALVTVGDEWKALGQTDSRYIDGLFRVLNYHIHPETDDLARMVLQGELGVIGKDVDGGWKALAKDWLVNEEDGRLMWRRMQAAKDGPKTIDELVENYQNFINKYLPTEDLKRLRLANADNPNAFLDHDVLKKLLKDTPEDLPKAVYAQDSWYVPKPWNVQQMKTSWKQIYGRSVLETPTAKVNRIPLAEQLYADEYRSLVANGVAKERARDIAEIRAVEKTNAVMFRISDESRFAAKADYIAPFQQPREELARVYFRLVMDNKGRVMQMGETGAKLFNNGKESGLFFQGTDKEWRMRVPGSAYLSRVFGAPEHDFDFRIRDAFFFLQGSTAYGAGFDPAHDSTQLLTSVLPSPGGPFWTMAQRYVFEHMPQLKKDLQGTWLWDRLFPYGDTGFLSRAESRHLYTAIFGGVAPWEIANKEAAENEVGKTVQTLVNLRRYANLDENGNPKNPNYFPSNEEIQEDLKTFYTLWSAFGSVVPATVRPVFAGKDEFQRIKDDYILKYGDKAYQHLYEDHPEASAIWLPRGTTRRDGAPDDFQSWLDQGNGISEKDYNNNYRRYLNVDEMRDVWQQHKVTQQVWDEYYSVANALYDTPGEKSQAIDAFKRKVEQEHPEFNFNTKYEKAKWLAYIEATAPDAWKNELLNAWRQTYNVSPQEYAQLRQDLRKEKFRVNPWIEARSTQEIIDLVRSAKMDATELNNTRNPNWSGPFKTNVDEREWVKTHLSPAEQVKYWGEQMTELMYYPEMSPYKADETDLPGDIVERWKFFKSQMNQVFAKHPELFAADNSRNQSSYDLLVKQMTGDFYKNLDASYDEINMLSEAKDQAYKNKDWTTYKALKGRVDDAYARQRAMINELHNRVADVREISDAKNDLLAMTGLVKPGIDVVKATRALGKMVGKYQELGMDGYYVPFSDEINYRQMNPSVRAAYVKDLTNKLSEDPKYDARAEIHAIRWSYLSDFQKQLVKDNAPALVDGFIEKDANWSELTKTSKTYYKKSYKKKRYFKKSYRRYGGAQDEATSALDYAYSLMRQFTQRAPGEKAPAEYANYIALPQDPGLRHQFLRDHPEVAEWIKKGPLANMDPLNRAIVTNIMIKYGKWEGEVQDNKEITEIAFARYQMLQWNKRGDMQKPDAYEAWLAMPTGPEKAAYIQAHPEIGEWLRLGPMHSMPDAYKNVVRDIMLRYGEWQQSQDPLGELMTQFNQLPGYARQKFLAEHPELPAFWTSLKSDDEKRQAQAAENYFAITSAPARKMYLEAHPELRDWFKNNRNAKYEKFLNQVAAFMGANPEMFQSYLDRQQDTMAELVRRFGENPFIREVPKVTSQAQNSKRGKARAA